MGQIPNPFLSLNGEQQALYNNELDKWLLNNQNTFEDDKILRGICRIIVIFIKEEN
jgi:hypothetical protein